MATIYRFIIEERQGGRSSGRTTDRGTKGAAKKGRNVSIFGGSKGGVEHNRKMRAINPLINKATGGIWEQGMRVGRAAIGLVTRNTETGKLGISGPALAIIIAWAIQTTLKIQNKSIQRANKQNTQNFNQLENGYGAIHGAYEVTSSWWNGRITLNQNK
jgi:hypothetical protein